MVELVKASKRPTVVIPVGLVSLVVVQLAILLISPYYAILLSYAIGPALAACGLYFYRRRESDLVDYRYSTTQMFEESQEIKLVFSVGLLLFAASVLASLFTALPSFYLLSSLLAVVIFRLTAHSYYFRYLHLHLFTIYRSVTRITSGIQTRSSTQHGQPYCLETHRCKVLFTRISLCGTY
jgi:hypothetical protein